MPFSRVSTQRTSDEPVATISSISARGASTSSKYCDTSFSASLYRLLAWSGGSALNWGSVIFGRWRPTAPSRSTAPNQISAHSVAQTQFGLQSLAFLPYLLGLLADARIKAGHQSEAMKAVKDAIAVAETSGERFYSAELYRLHGELLAQQSISQCENAEAEFRRAINIANQQGALSLERRARVSLRHWIG
jgi:hypothetical protein